MHEFSLDPHHHPALVRPHSLGQLWYLLKTRFSQINDMSILGGVNIPEDVLGVIFEETTPQDLASAFPYPHLSPLLLGQVCRDWRRLSHGNTSLWKLLSLQVEVYGDCQLADTVAVKLISQTQSWLDRCGEKGLCLVLNIYPKSIVIAVLEAVIVKNLGRFQSLDITNLPLRAIANSHSSIPLPLLHTFSISGHPSEDNEIFPDTLDRWAVLTQSRALRRLHIGVPGDTWASLPRVPWAQLTHLSLTPLLSATLLYDLFKACDNLEQCIVAVNKPSTLKPTVTVPHLHSLDITYVGTDRDVNDLSYTQFPSLQSFALRATNKAYYLMHSLETPSAPRNAFYGQLRNIRNLTIHMGQSLGISSGALIHIFHSTPGLETLTLSCSQRNYTPLIRALSNDRDDGNLLLPRLRSFTLCLTFARYIHQEDLVSAEDFARMAHLRSGQASSSKLAQCAIVLHVDPDVDDERWEWKDDILQAYAESTGEGGDVVVPFRIVEDAYSRCCAEDQYGSPWSVTTM